MKWFILSDGETKIVDKIKKDYKKLSGSIVSVNEIVLPDNIIYFENEYDFESYIIENGFVDEIESCLKTILNTDDLDEIIANKNGICTTCNQNIFQEDFRDYNGIQGRKSALNDLLSQNKTKYSSLLSELIYKSDKNLPPKIIELFTQLNLILKIAINDEN